MSHNKEFMKNSLIIMISEIMLKLQVFIFLPLITKTFGAVNYGIWAQVGVIQSLVSPLVVMGLDSASTRFVPGQPKEEMARSFSTIYLYLITSSFIFGTGIIFLSPTIAESFFGGKENIKFVVLCAPAILFGVLLSMLKTYFIILNQAKKFTVTRIVESLLPIIPLIIVVALGLSLFTLVSAKVASIFLVTLLFAFPLLKSIGFKAPNFGMLPGFLKFGAAIMPAGYASWALNASDRLFIARIRNLHELGVYSAAYNIAYTLIPLFFMPFRAMYPARATEFYNKNDIESLNSLFRNTTKIITFLIVPSIVGLSLIGKPFMKFLTTPDFVEGGALMPYIALGYVFYVMSSYFSVNLGLANKPIFSTISISICAIINLILNYILISHFGIKGAAIATCISFGLQFVLEFYFSNRLTNIRLRFDFIALAKTLLATSIMSFFILFIGIQYITNLFRLIIIVLSSAFIYFAAQHCLKFFNYKEILSFLEIMRLESLSKSNLFKILTSHIR
jgi:O-antigen/teichoic acid export membrane protein